MEQTIRELHLELQSTQRALMRASLPAVRAYLEDTVAELRRRIAVMERRAACSSRFGGAYLFAG